MNAMKSRTWQLVALGLALLALPSAALEKNATLGASGEVFLVKADQYGNLFPKGRAAAAGSFVLALDVAKPGQPLERLLVPGTKADDVESSPALVFEEHTNTLFLVWASQVNSIHSVLRLASYDGDEWFGPVQISSNEFSSKVSPLLAITRDSYTDTDSEGAPLLRHRTILHLVWQEEDRENSFDLFYSPLIVEDGHFLGWNPIFNLSSQVAQEEPAEAPAPLLQLVHAPTIQRGRDARTLTVGMVEEATRRLFTLEIDVLPEELGRLGEKARAAIIDMGHRGTDRPTLAAKTRDEILKVGHFQPEVLTAIAVYVYDLVLNSGTEAPEILGEKARAAIIDMGARMSDRGLRPDNRESKSRIESVERDCQEDQGTQANVPHLLRFRVASSRPAPVVETGPVKLFVSESGSEALVSWVKDDRVFYRLSTDNGWSDTNEVQITSSVTLDKAYELLESKVRNR